MARLAWLRGDSTQEALNGGIFRSRTNGVLGDIVNSAPVFVGAPNARYPDYWPGASAPENAATAEDYSTFKYNNASRLPMVYVGTNGGTVNGFDADFTAANVEKLAYVPTTDIQQSQQAAGSGLHTQVLRGRFAHGRGHLLLRRRPAGIPC